MMTAGLTSPRKRNGNHRRVSSNVTPIISSVRLISRPSRALPSLSWWWSSWRCPLPTDEEKEKRVLRANLILAKAANKRLQLALRIANETKGVLAMIKHKGLIAFLTVLANAAMLAVTKQVVHPGSLAFYIVGLVGAICANVLMVLGAPLLTPPATQDPDKTPVKPPAPPKGFIRAEVLMLLGALGFLAILFGCAHVSPSVKAFDTAFASCMKDKGLSAAPGVADQVFTDLTSGTSKDVILSQLEGLAGQASAAAIGCAVFSWLHPATPASLNPAGVAAANAWLSAHK